MRINLIVKDKAGGQAASGGVFRFLEFKSTAMIFFHKVPPKVAEAAELWFKWVMKRVITLILRKSFPHTTNLLP